MQKLVLFIEPNNASFETLEKIGNLFVNRFAIEEDGQFEILKIFQLENGHNHYIDGLYDYEKSISKLGKGLNTSKCIIKKSIETTNGCLRESFSWPANFDFSRVN